MWKRMLTGLMLLGAVAAAAGEASASPRGEAPVKTDFDQACLGAIWQITQHYGDPGGEPLPERAVALIKRCNANPDPIPCEVASKVTLREYGKTPFACGVDTEYTGPYILLPDTR